MIVEIKADGFQQGIENLKSLSDKLKKKIIRKAVRAGSRPMVQAVKSSVNYQDDTGTLRRNVVSTAKTSGVLFSQRISFRGSKTVIATDRQGRKRKRNPRNYAHLLELGHKIAIGGRLRSRFAVEWSVVNGKRRKRRNLRKIIEPARGIVAGVVEPRPFMKPAFDQTKTQQLESLRAKLAEEVVREVEAMPK